MSLNIKLDKSEDLTLLDAIAYEFFMDHINGYVDPTEEEVEVQVAKLALASFHVGEIFILARDKYYQKTDDTDT